MMGQQHEYGPAASAAAAGRPRRRRSGVVGHWAPLLVTAAVTASLSSSRVAAAAAVAAHTGDAGASSTRATAAVAGGGGGVVTPAIIPLERRQRRQRQPEPSDGEGNKDKQAATARLTEFDAVSSAYFASLEVVGPEQDAQTIDVLVDTGSSHLLLPSSLCDPGACATESGPVLQTLDLEAAGAEIVGCEDPRCQGFCTHDMLAARGLLGRDGGTPDATCGPHGGICQPSSISSSPSSPFCLVADSYADGSWALGPLFATPAIRLAGLSVPAPLFAAVAEASPSFFEAPQGGGIMGLAMGRELGQRAKEDCGTPCLTPLLDRLWAAEGAAGNSNATTAQTLPNRFSIVGQGERAALLLLGAGGNDPSTAPYRRGPARYSPLQKPWAWYTVGVLGLEISTPPLTAAPAGLRAEGGTAKDKGQAAGAAAANMKDDDDDGTSVVARYHEKPSAGAGAILDTGTTGLFVPSAAFAFFRDTLQTRFCHVPHICAPSADKEQTRRRRLRGRGRRRGRRQVHVQEDEDEEAAGGGDPTTTIFDGDGDVWVPWDADTVAQLPWLTFLLQPEEAGQPPVRLALGPEQYLARARDGEGATYYSLAIGAMDGGAGKGGKGKGGGDGDGGGGYLLGEALLSEYFVEFDREGKRVGFAPAAWAE